jgi:hypothetical protein
MSLLLAALTLSVQLQRGSYDLLDDVNVEVAAHNSAKAPVTVKFAKPAEYRVEVLHDGRVVWHSADIEPPDVTFPVHERTFLPGPTVLVIYAWNDLTADGLAIAPGSYTIRAQLLGRGVEPQAQTTAQFIAPIPISAVTKLRAGDVVTIAGHVDASLQTLHDATGSMKLSRRLLGAGNALVVVRGYLTTLPGDTNVFSVVRWARLSTSPFDK